MVTVRIETDVTLDINMMAKAFAHMNGDEQACFLALCHRQMATYTRREPDGTDKELGAHGRELQMLAIKDSFDQQPGAREFILSLYQMTIEEDEEPKTSLDNPPGGIMDSTFQPCCGAMWEQEHKAGCPSATSWDDTNSNPIEDFRKAKAMIEADTGFKPGFDAMGEAAKKYFDQQSMAARDFAHQYIGTPIEDIRDEEVVKALKHEPTTQEARWLAAATRHEIEQPLEVISEGITWPGLGESKVGSLTASYVTPRSICHCRHLTGVWNKVDDRVRVEASTNMERWGIVTKVYADGNMDVLLDVVPPATSPKEARAQSILLNSARITVKADSVDIYNDRAYVKADRFAHGAYIGRVTDVCSDGTVTIEAVHGVKSDDPLTIDQQVVNVGSDEVVLDAIRNKKRVCNLLTADDDVGPLPLFNDGFIVDKVFPKKSPNADAVPCEECKGTGTWTNPFNDEPSPCSRGCKS